MGTNSKEMLGSMAIVLTMRGVLQRGRKRTHVAVAVIKSRSRADRALPLQEEPEPSLLLPTDPAFNAVDPLESRHTYIAYSTVLLTNVSPDSSHRVFEFGRATIQCGHHVVFRDCEVALGSITVVDSQVLFMPIVGLVS